MEAEFQQIELERELMTNKDVEMIYISTSSNLNIFERLYFYFFQNFP